MGRVTSQCVHLRPNDIALPVQFYIAPSGIKALNLSSNRAFSLVPHEDNIMALITEHSLEVVDDTPPGAHSVTSNYNGQLDLVTVDGQQVAKCQGVAPLF